MFRQPMGKQKTVCIKSYLLKLGFFLGIGEVLISFLQYFH